MRIFSARQESEFGFHSYKLLQYILALHTLATAPIGGGWGGGRERNILAISSCSVLFCAEKFSVSCGLIQKVPNEVPVPPLKYADIRLLIFCESGSMFLKWVQ